MGGVATPLAGQLLPTVSSPGRQYGGQYHSTPGGGHQYHTAPNSGGPGQYHSTPSSGAQYQGHHSTPAHFPQTHAPQYSQAAPRFNRQTRISP